MQIRHKLYFGNLCLIFTVLFGLQVLLLGYFFSVDIIYDYVCYIGNIKFSKFFGLFFELLSVIEFQSKSGSQSPAEVAKSNKQWVGTYLYQEGYKPLLINCEAVIRL